MFKTLFFAAVLVASSFPGGARAAGADEAFAETREAYQSLKKDPERRKFRHHWLNMARKLEAFGKRYPKSERTPDALYLTGDLYATLWRFSQEGDDLKAAEQAWRKLTESFPSHRLADDAALQLARQLADRKGELDEARRVVESALPHAKDRKKELEELLVGLKEARKKKAGSDDSPRRAVASEEAGGKGSAKGGDEKGAATRDEAITRKAGGREVKPVSGRGKAQAEEAGGAARREVAASRGTDEGKAGLSARPRPDDDARGKAQIEEAAGSARRDGPARRGTDEIKPGLVARPSPGDDARKAPADAPDPLRSRGARRPAEAAIADDDGASEDERAAPKVVAVDERRGGDTPRGPAAAARRTVEPRPENKVARAEQGRITMKPAGSAARLGADDDSEAGEEPAAPRPGTAGGRAQDVLAAIRKVSARALRTTPALDAGVDTRHAARAPEPRSDDARTDAVEEQGQTSTLATLQERLRDVRVGTRKVDEASARSRMKGLTAAEAATELSLSQQLGLKVRRVVVDAGHGGHDTGAIGPHGSREKDVALAIAKKLAARLEAMGLEVVLTRDDDTFVALEERTAIANREKGDLFISVHCNAAPGKALRGVETYSLNTASTRYAVRLAARENASSERGVSDLQYILADLATKANTGESERLAQRVQKSLVRSLNEKHPGVRDLGPKQALFFVLLGARMPAILVETSFISNPQEEELLGSEAYQNDAADGVAGAVQDFLDERNRVAQVD